MSTWTVGLILQVCRVESSELFSPRDRPATEVSSPDMHAVETLKLSRGSTLRERERGRVSLSVRESAVSSYGACRLFPHVQWFLGKACVSLR